MASNMNKKNDCQSQTLSLDFWMETTVATQFTMTYALPLKLIFFPKRIFSLQIYIVQAFVLNNYI